MEPNQTPEPNQAPTTGPTPSPASAPLSASTQIPTSSPTSTSTPSPSSTPSPAPPLVVNSAPSPNPDDLPTLDNLPTMPDLTNLESTSSEESTPNLSTTSTDPTIVDSSSAPTEPSVSSEEATLSSPISGTADLSDPVSSATNLNSSNTQASPEDSSPASTETSTPLTPAPPAPGSIGSAISYSENSSIAPKPVKKPKTTLILIIVLAVVVLAAGVFFLINALAAKPNKRPTPKPSKNTPAVVTKKTLTCSRELNADELISLGNATSATTTVTIELDQGKVVTAKHFLTSSYSDASAAGLARDNATKSYSDELRHLGIGSDPFDSQYELSGNDLKVTHQTSNLGEKDTGYFRLTPTTDKNGDTVYDLDTTKSSYEAVQYHCQVN